MKTIRSASDRVAELNAKIAQIEAREKRKAERVARQQNPLWKLTTAAAKLIEKAKKETTDEATIAQLDKARGALARIEVSEQMVAPLRESLASRRAERGEQAAQQRSTSTEPVDENQLPTGPRALKPREKKQSAAQ